MRNNIPGDILFDIGQSVLRKPFIYLPVSEQRYNPVNIFIISLSIKPCFRFLDGIDKCREI